MGERRLNELRLAAKASLTCSDIDPRQSNFSVKAPYSPDDVVSLCKRISLREGEDAVKIQSEIALEVMGRAIPPTTLKGWMRRYREIQDQKNVIDRRRYLQPESEKILSDTINECAIARDAMSMRRIRELAGRLAQLERGLSYTQPATRKWGRAFMKHQKATAGITGKKEE